MRQFFDELLREIRDRSNPVAAVPSLGAGDSATLLTLGKCAVFQAAALRQALEAHGVRIRSALAVTKAEDARPDGLDVLIADHPVPSGRSRTAARELLQRAGASTDSLVVAISGGGSSLAFDPLQPIGLEDLRALTDAARSIGLPIDRWNSLRRSLCRLKNGGLARATGARVTHGLLTVDVPTRNPAEVASGPLSAEPIDRPALSMTLDELVTSGGLASILAARFESAIASTREDQGDRASNIELKVVADDRDLRLAARAAFERCGLHDIVEFGPRDRAVSAPIQTGVDSFEAELGPWLQGRVESQATGVFLTTGEFEVPVRESSTGRGGRCSTFVAELGARLLDSRQRALTEGRIVVLAVASDGDDGNSQRSGGFLELHSGLDSRLLYEAVSGASTSDRLDQIGCSFPGCATGTNLMDLYAVIYLPRS